MPIITTGGIDDPSADVLALIEKHLERLVRQGVADDDVLERIQQQLATINEDDNLEPHKRRF